MTSKLTPQKMKAISALLASPSISAAALKVDVTRKTLHKWLKDPEFSAELEAAQREILLVHISRLAGMLQLAANTYETILKDCEDEAVQLRAADSIHRSFDQMSNRIASEKELVEFERRLQELEAATK